MLWKLRPSLALTGGLDSLGLRIWPAYRMLVINVQRGRPLLSYSRVPSEPPLNVLRCVARQHHRPVNAFSDDGQGEMWITIPKMKEMSSRIKVKERASTKSKYVFVPWSGADSSGTCQLPRKCHHLCVQLFDGFNMEPMCIKVLPNDKDDNPQFLIYRKERTVFSRLSFPAPARILRSAHLVMLNGLCLLATFALMNNQNAHELAGRAQDVYPLFMASVRLVSFHHLQVDRPKHLRATLHVRVIVGFEYLCM